MAQQYGNDNRKNSSDTVLVGTFSNTPSSAISVPSRLNGAKIWYSESHGFFLVTSPSSNEIIGKIDTHSFIKYLNAKVVSFTNNGTERFIYSICNNSKDNDEPSEGYYGASSNHRIPANDNENDYDVKSKNNDNEDFYDVREQQPYQAKKDPTAKLPAFFITTLIIAVLVVLIINFAPSITSVVSTLLF